MSDWIVEYSTSQRCGHIESPSTIQARIGDWMEIARLDCTWQEAVEWFSDWKKRNIKTKQKPRKVSFCHPDDRSIPIGKRKVEFVKWLMRQGKDNRTARLICKHRFLKEEVLP